MRADELPGLAREQFINGPVLSVDQLADQHADDERHQHAD
jgi:hypothetical protein